jgi:hypothetical protein
MPVHLPDPCDKAMTIHATDGPKESTTRISYTPPPWRNSAMRHSGDMRARMFPGSRRNLRRRGLVRNCARGPERRLEGTLAASVEFIEMMDRPLRQRREMS